MKKKGKQAAAVKVRELVKGVLTQARDKSGKTSMTWRELQAVLQHEIDLTWGEERFTIDPRVLLGVLLVKDSPVEVIVRLPRQ